MFVFLLALVLGALLLCAYICDLTIAEEENKKERENEKKDRCVDLSPCCQACPPDPIVYPYGTLVDVYLEGKLFDGRGVKVVGYREGCNRQDLHYRVKSGKKYSEVPHYNVRPHVSYEEKLDLIEKELTDYRDKLMELYGIKSFPLSRVL